MAVKLIVTHINPDLDAVTSVWVLKRFDEQHFGECGVDFVSAGERISKASLAKWGMEEYEVVHVDTGMGEFDHHTSELAHKKVCAASLVRDHVIEVHPELATDMALKRIVDYAVEIDHFGELYWPEPTSDRYLFLVDEILPFLKGTGWNDTDVVAYALRSLDAIYAAFKARIEAEEELASAKPFNSQWGKAVALMTANDEVLKLAQKRGFNLVIRKDPKEGNIRIKGVPGKNIDLSAVYEKIVGRDHQATWFLHPGKSMLLNGSKKGNTQVPSSLSLEEVVAMVRG